MSYAIITAPAAAVRRKARHQAEMVNQLLFGEAVRVIKEKKGGWLKVRSLHDKYEGWLTQHLLSHVPIEEAEAKISHLVSGHLASVTVENTRMWIPGGSVLPGLQDAQFKIAGRNYVFAGEVISRGESVFSEEKLIAVTHSWLNVPYLWGGRTLMGVDCSGFVQMSYRAIGLDLPRDAWQQAQEGKTVEKLKDALPGDLAFFDDRDEIVHVGIIISSDQIIHASGKVRIDKIDKKGIVHSETGKRTHSLRVIKRPW